MWMMGYNDGGDFHMADSFNGRKLRPIIPRVPVVTCTNTTTATTNPPCLSRINHGSDFFSQYHHLASVADQNKREFNTTPQVVVSSRWNPTPEQLRALEELYRRGTRTPNAEQIQHITAQLRRYGKIEGKNVFYWFQNHKARERQKRRRQTESAAPVPDHELDMSEKKELGASRTTIFEVEQTKNWAPSTNCSTLTEESVSIQRATKAGVTECVTDGWIQFGEGELQQQQQQRRNFLQRNATWQMMQLSCPPHPPTHHLINTTRTRTRTPTTTAAATTTTRTTPTRTPLRTMDQKLIKTQDLSIFIAPPYRYESGVYNHVNNHVFGRHEEEDCYGDEYQSQTLQLFPLRSCNENEILGEKETDQISVSAMNGSFSATTPCLQFIEFLPLKN